MSLTTAPLERGHQTTPGKRKGTRSSGRHDIQGLRAVAVLAVVLNHLLEWPRGGFVGVDVFFVISGFLITGLLLREHDRTGHISFLDFYRRRVKRIMPAAVVVLVVTLIGARLIFLETRFRASVVDSVWALFFSANWRFASASTDYFEQNRPVSPVQHFWSLSVEEQFYLVWPWLMLAIFALLVRGQRRHQARLVLLVTISALSVVSFAWAVYQTTTTPEVAYFSTLTRVWELGVGAGLAVLSPALHRIPDRLRPGLAWLGLIGIGISVAVVTEQSAFPAPAAALPVLTAALVIAAGTYADPRRQLRLLWPLTNPLSRYVGDISYSLYLWHFPVVILLAAYVGDAIGPAYYVVAAVLMLAASIGSYHLVEQPLRQSPFLERFESSAQRRTAFSRWWRRWRGALSGATAIAVLVLVGAVVRLVVFAPDPAPQAQDTSYADAGQKPAPGQPSAQERLAADLETAAAATDWPVLDPPLEEVASSGAPPVEVRAGCDATDPVDEPDLCTFGRGEKPVAYVLGDSTGIALLPTVRGALGDRYLIKGLTMSSCQVPVEKVYNDAELQSECTQHVEDSLRAVVEAEPAVVFLSDAYDVADRLASGAEGEAATEEWRAGLQAVVDEVKDSAGQVVVVSPPAQGLALEECATAVSTPQDCITPIPETYRLAHDAEEQVQGSNVHYLDTRDWFCTADDRCPPFVGDTLTRRDDVHTSLAWSRKIAPLFAAQVEPWLAPRDAG